MIEVKKESFVFTKEQGEKALYQFIEEGSLNLYTIDDDGNPEKYFTENKDYVVDYEKGIIKRSENSSIHDFSTHIFYGQNPFNQEGKPEEQWSNAKYTVYADYKSKETREIIDNGKTASFPKFFEKIKRKEEVTVIIFGDSISTGCEATENNTYFALLKTYLEETYGAKVNMKNYSVGGDNTVDAMKRIKGLDLKCDLAVIAFGMNDQNYNAQAKEPFVSPEWYGQNVAHFSYLFQASGAEVLLVSPHIPNPKWIYTSNWLEDYVCVLRHIAFTQGIRFADVYETFRLIYARGKSYESMLRNDINHPNDFGHKLYFETLKRFF